MISIQLTKEEYWEIYSIITAEIEQIPEEGRSAVQKRLLSILQEIRRKFDQALNEGE